MNPINNYCPRSGKAVNEEALTTYKGFTVGFCNKGCRDNFSAHVEDRPMDRHYFDTIITENDLGAETNT